MLRFIKVQNSEQIRKILSSYDPLKDTWIVSDLKSKQEIQNEAILKYGYFTDDAILRVSDFWRLWIRRLEPTLNVVSSDFITSLVQNFIEQYGTELDLLESESSTLSKALQEFAAILLHPESFEVIEEWLEAENAKTHKNKKWQKWFKLANTLMNYLVEKRNIIDSRWSAAFLQSRNIDDISWDRRLFVDLGSEMSSVEMGLFKTLAQKQEVVIITPDPAWSHQFPFLLGVYKDHFGYGKVEDAERVKPASVLKPGQFKRLSTQLAEVKFAVAQARQWADSGVPVTDIAIIAADIEKYWPVLQHYLIEEGLPFRKDIVAKVNSLGDIQNLLAALKNLSQDVSWDSLERAMFSGQQTDYEFEKFKGLFYQIYDDDDLARDEKIKKLFFKKIDFVSEIDRDEFLAFTVKTWMSLPPSTTKNEIFETVFKDLIKQSLNVKFKLKLWIQFFKNRLSSLERNVERAANEGVQVLSLMSGHMLGAQHKIYLGLNDELYAKKQLSLMNLSDANLIKNQFDLSIDCSEESYLDFNLRWQSTAATEKTLFTSAHLSFNSDPLNASLFFIENLPQSDVEAPAATRIDELQQAYVDLDQVKETSVSKNRLNEDKKGYELQFKSEVFKNLSVSDIENYAKCSFKLLAGKGFRLRDYSQVGIDLDNRDKGNIAHSLFQFMVEKALKEPWNEAPVIEFLNAFRTEKNLYVHLDAVWDIQRAKFVSLARKFYEFEKQRSQLFNIQAEKNVQIYFDTSKKEFSATPPANGFTFNMRIDRLDVQKEKKYSIIYYYKSSADPNHKAARWIDNLQFQMLLYITALKLTMPENLNIKGSLYYYYKNFDLKTGLIDDQVGLNEFLFHESNKSLYDEAEWQELEKSFLTLISDILVKLEGGHFASQPYKNDICDRCDWRKLCRATHLM
ncbi:MAG: PD-(D/E)XK nuclease family protein [Pseudobdellovibrio sp.]